MDKVCRKHPGVLHNATLKEKKQVELECIALRLAEREDLVRQRKDVPAGSAVSGL